MFLQSKMIQTPKPCTAWPESRKPETSWLPRVWLRNVARRRLTPASLFFPFKKNPLTQRPSWSGPEACLPLLCLVPCNKSLLCSYSHGQSLAFCTAGTQGLCLVRVHTSIFPFKPALQGISWAAPLHWTVPDKLLQIFLLHSCQVIPIYSQSM